MCIENKNENGNEINELIDKQNSRATMKRKPAGKGKSKESIYPLKDVRIPQATAFAAE